METVTGIDGNHDVNNNEKRSSSSSSWSCATNWTIARGSLHSCVTFESLDSPIADDSRTLKSPLILVPPSPDSGPCEIKISFTQKHEICQVYVRSTARVYEIYYAPALQSTNEYLCTVRCSIASREEELLHATDIEEAVHSHPKGANGELAEEKFTGVNNIGTNEDDWVEVKIPDSPLLDNGKSYFPMKTSANTRSIKDFFEATAEISDAYPCMSVTLRLLSLQSEGCVYVDEVYVFADPIESADSESQAVQLGSSAGSALMAMFVPTLLQLSKSGVGQLQDKHASNMMEKRENLEIGSRTTDSTNVVIGIQQDEKSKIANQQEVELQEVSGATSEPGQFHIAAQVSDREKKYDSVANNDMANSHVERILEQLVSRISRVEDLCLRFEEKMLTPINSMEARLQRVEQQLEVLAKSSELPSCTRFSAPTFSCIGSNSSSFYNDGSDHPPFRASECEKDTPSSKICKSPNDTSTSVSVPQFLPSLVVTAPEFSCGDDEEENDVGEPSMDSPQEKPEKALSVDDALAAALAGFLSMTSVQPSKDPQILTVAAPEFTSEENSNDEPSKYTQTLKVTAPEFPSEENGNDDKVAAPSVQNEKPVVPFDSCATNGKECIHVLVSTSSDTSSAGARQATKVLDDVYFEETLERFDEQYQFSEWQAGCSCPSAQAILDLTTDDFQITEEAGKRECSNILSEVSISEKTNILRQVLGNQTNDSSDTTQEVVGAIIGDVDEGSNKDMLINVPKSSYPSVLDFEIPILDVEFASWENSSTKSPLEVLLTDVAGIDVDTPFVPDSDDCVVIAYQSYLSSVEDGETMSTLTKNNLLVDLDSYDVGEGPSDMAGEGLQDHLPCINQEMFASLI